MTALRLFDDDFEPVARRTDPDTSWAAAEDASVNAATHRARVLAALRAHPDGLTDFELGDLLGLQQTSVGKRRGELRDKGLVFNAGFKRPAPSGSMSIVWKAVPRAALVGAAMSPLPSAMTNGRGESEEVGGAPMG